MWSGSITLGILNVPITIGKAWEDERERSMRDVCVCHGLPIEKHERCAKTKERPPMGKTKGVEMANGKWRKLSVVEVSRIEDATKSDSLEILDVQPEHEYPLEYSIGTYYIRPAPKADMRSFQLLVHGLTENNRGALVKWCRSTTQKLAVLRVWNGILMLSVIPFRSAWREPGEQERRHYETEVDPKMYEVMSTLLDATSNPNGFEWDQYADDGLAIRAEAVAKVMKGQRFDETPRERQSLPDLMAALETSVRQQSRRRPARRTPRAARRAARRRTKARA
jgi:non-homologous end joining protein Ku